MSKKRVLTEAEKTEILRMYKETICPVEIIRRKFSLKIATLTTLLKSSFTLEFRDMRKRACYSASKTGDLNPTYKKRPAVYRGEPVSDARGYLMVLKPEWYTGRVGSKYVFQHTIVMCEYLGICELPKGSVVHHIDGNKHNNYINNLALMNIAGHCRLHSLEVQRLSERSRLVEQAEAHDVYCNSIVK